MGDTQVNTEKGPAQSQPQLFEDRIRFDPRFLERLVGRRMLDDPCVALTELVANAWDAGATTVRIAWPLKSTDSFSISDVGEGMTKEEFLRRWQTMAYNRLVEQGPTTAIVGMPGRPLRRVYGRNGVGRFAAFCFGDSYELTTSRDGTEVRYHISKSEHADRPFEKVLLSEKASQNTGTQIAVKHCRPLPVSEDHIRAELAMRFLADPDFRVYVNERQVELHSIPNANIETETVDVAGVGPVELITIDTTTTDRTTRSHGVAFHVNNRLVGEVTWKHPGFANTVDGRSAAGKRLLIIVRADALQDREAVLVDWTGFKDDNDAYRGVASAVEKAIEKRIDAISVDEQAETLEEAKAASIESLRKLEVSALTTWSSFVSQATKECRSLRREDLVKLAALLARLEMCQSKYALISRLADEPPGNLDALHEILSDWTIDTAKIVLDEIRTRMRFLAELERKVADPNTDEVHELQPLFEKGLWIFGPEFETIHFTSNRTMNSVIDSLFNPKIQIVGSRYRPDFVILPDGSVGCFSHQRFGRLADGDSGEMQVGRLVIVELKKPGVPLGSDQKSQCWRYVTELLKKGLINRDVHTDCFVLGKTVDPFETAARNELDGACKIQPMTYDTVIERAKSRLLYLYDEVRRAPFLEKAVAEFETTGKLGEPEPTLYDKAPAI
jgi:hypothetical protein